MDIAVSERLSHESTREYVYRCLKENIMNLRLPPGSALSEKDISILLNVSRTPVREAFIQLESEYLLDILPQKGTRVSLLDVENVEESFFLRETIEKEVINLAVKEFPADKLFELQSNITLQELCVEEENYLKFFELDEALHRCIFEGCRKGRIWSLIQQMSTHYNRVRMLNVAGKHDWPELLSQHEDLVRAIREKNLSLAAKTIQKHLNKIRIDIEDLLIEFRHYFI
ncbi:GntR family transcriptional regulator [Desulfosporosinus sp. SYSU MS00001]|uniref:GntR family transcriptional regulator n=1 Tax=Desulfosporosinus sp. SYSU MS00001 TaxID=3416284 RepID=UPI003CF55A41